MDYYHYYYYVWGAYRCMGKCTDYGAYRCIGECNGGTQMCGDIETLQTLLLNITAN